MDNNKKIQTSPPRLISYSEKRRKSTKLKTIKDINLSNNKYNTNIKTKQDKEENRIINLQTGGIKGKLYKKTNETEWAAQNRAIKEKSTSNYEIKQILKRYNYNKGKLKLGFTNEYINILTELLHSGKRDYSKERLKLSKNRLHINKNSKEYKDFINSYNNLYLNKFDNNNFINNNINQKIMIGSSPIKNNNFIINEDKYNIKSPNLLNKTIILNNKIILEKINNINQSNNININNNTYSNFHNNIYNIKYNRLNTDKFKSNNIYLKLKELDLLNNTNRNNNNNALNLSNKSLDKVNSLNNSNYLKSVKRNKNNSPKKKCKTVYKNERDIYFEKEKEEDEFILSGDKDKYETYLKNKFDFFEDMKDKQTQYIYEIKKRNMTIFNNKNIEMKNNHINALNYLKKMSRANDIKLENQKKYNIHDLFKEKYTKAQISKCILNNKSKKIMKNLKYILK